MGSPYSFADSGDDLVIVRSKIANIICVFDLPKDYHHKDNHFVITVINESNNVVFSMKSKDSNVFLPVNLSDTYYISINLNGHTVSQKVTL